MQRKKNGKKERMADNLENIISAVTLFAEELGTRTKISHLNRFQGAVR